MTRTTLVMATALATVATLIAVPAVTAAPTVRARLVDGTLRVAGSPFADQIALRRVRSERKEAQHLALHVRHAVRAALQRAVLQRAELMHHRVHEFEHRLVLGNLLTVDVVN